MRPRPGESKKRWLSRFMASSAHRELAPSARVQKAHEMFAEARKPAETERTGDRDDCECGGTCKECKTRKGEVSASEQTPPPADYPRHLSRTSMAHREAHRHFKSMMGDFRKGRLYDATGTVIKDRKQAATMAYKAACDRRGKRIVQSGEMTQKSAVNVQSKDDIARQTPLERARQITDPNPTEQQKKTGRYRKGKVIVQGLRIAIENPQGSIRSGVNRDGVPWERRMTFDYGCILGVEDGADGDPVDVYLGPLPWARIVYVIDQIDTETRQFDEHKVMLGFRDELDARNGYLSNYDLGYPCFGEITAMPMADFKKWLMDGGPKLPASRRLRMASLIPVAEMLGETKKSGTAAPQFLDGTTGKKNRWQAFRQSVKSGHEGESYFGSCERDEQGHCLPQGASGDKHKSDAKSKKTGAAVRKYPKLPISHADAVDFAETGQASGFRIQDSRSKLPKRSQNTWQGDEEEEMPGVSGFANLSNAIDDLLFGRNESATGDNYTQFVEAAGGKPLIVVMNGNTVDGPGAEVILPKPRIAAVFDRKDVEKAFRESLFDSLNEYKDSGEDDTGEADPNDALKMKLPELLRKYSIEPADVRRVEERLIENFRKQMREEQSDQSQTEKSLLSATAAPQSAAVQSLGGSLVPLPGSTHKHIVKLASGKFRLLSRKKNPKTGESRNLGTFPSRQAALKHERAVEYFKHGGKSMTAKSESAATRREAEEHQKGSSFRKVLDQFKRGTLKNKAGEPIANWHQMLAVAYGEQRASERAHGRPVVPQKKSDKSLTRKCGGEGGKPGPCPGGGSLTIGVSHEAEAPKRKPPSSPQPEGKFKPHLQGALTVGKTEAATRNVKRSDTFDHRTHAMPIGSKVTARRYLRRAVQLPDKSYPDSEHFAKSQERLTVLEHRGGEGTKTTHQVKVRNGRGEEAWIDAMDLRGKTRGYRVRKELDNAREPEAPSRFGERREPLIAGMRKKSRWSKSPWRGNGLTQKSWTYRDRGESFFADCPRDDKGHCTKGAGGGSTPKKKDAGDKKERQSKPHAKPKPTRSEMVSVRREGKGKDAKLVLANGEPAPAHIRAGRIPPAWSDVTVSTDPDADVQIQGKNKRGKTQTLFSDKWDMKTAAAKFSRIHDALHEMPGMMAQVQKDRANPKKAGAADCTWLMMEQGTRPGSEADNKGVSGLFGHKLSADDVVVSGTDKKGVPKVTLRIDGKDVPVKDKKARAELARRKEAGEPLHDSTYWLKSHGATTLEGRHVVETKDGVRLQFMGKESVYHDHLVRDPELAKMLLERKKAAGDGGKLFGVSDGQVSRYAKKLDGGGFSPKDWRTAKGTRMAIAEIARGQQPTDEKSYRAAVMDVAHKVSSVLGNEPEIALSAYISPMVFSSWRASAGV